MIHTHALSIDHTYTYPQGFDDIIHTTTTTMRVSAGGGDPAAASASVLLRLPPPGPASPCKCALAPWPSSPLTHGHALERETEKTFYAHHSDPY